MEAMCKCDDGFEDQLTKGAVYKIRRVGENSYLIENDNEDWKWYGQQHFGYVRRARK